MKIKTYKKLFPVLFVATLFACGGQDPATEQTIDASQTNVGTKVGNPLPPQNAVIQFKAAPIEQAGLSTTNGVASSCVPVINAEQKQTTQICRLTPATLDISIVNIELGDCRDADDHSSLCHLLYAQTALPIASLYTGEPLILSLAGTLQSISTTTVTGLVGIDTGGFMITVAYVGQTLPSLTSDPAMAELIDPELQGKSLRVCTSPNLKLAPALMAIRCGNAQAQFGDWLIDMNDDGQFGFFVIDERGQAQEAANRSAMGPKGHLDLMELSLFQYPYTLAGTDSNGISGYYTQLAPLATNQIITLNASSVFTVTYHLDEAFAFVDGSASEDNCVSGIAAVSCGTENSDPSTVGLYYPIYDGYPKFLSMPVSLSLVE